MISISPVFSRNYLLKPSFATLRLASSNLADKFEKKINKFYYKLWLNFQVGNTLAGSLRAPPKNPNYLKTFGPISPKSYAGSISPVVWTHIVNENRQTVRNSRHKPVKLQKFEIQNSPYQLASPVSDQVHRACLLNTVLHRISLIKWTPILTEFASQYSLNKHAGTC